MNCLGGSLLYIVAVFMETENNNWVLRLLIQWVETDRSERHSLSVQWSSGMSVLNMEQWNVSTEHGAVECQY